MSPARRACCLVAAVLAAAVPVCARGAAPAEATAKALLDAAGVRAGLCVHAGCGDGRLTAALTAGGNFVTHALATDEASLAAARDLLHTRGLYGKASVERISLARLPYAARTVNLLVADDLAAAMKAGLTFREALRVLVPGGAALLGRPGGVKPVPTEKELRAALAAAGVTDFDILRANGLWVRLREGRPDGLGDWPHADGPADGTCVAPDTVAGPPAMLKWRDRPMMYLTHYTRPAGWVSDGGRVFYVYDERHPRLAEAAEWNLVARDAYNGKLLWRRPVPVPTDPKQRKKWQFAAGMLVAAGDRLYAPMGENGSLAALDPATGKSLLDYKTRFRTVRVHRGSLVLLDSAIHVIDPATGQVRWTKRPGFYYKALLAADGRLWATERRRDPKTREQVQGIVCLDLKTGREIWWRPVPETLSCHHRGKVIAATRIQLNHKRPRRLVALNAETGEIEWTHEHTASGRARFYCIGDRLWYAGAGQCWTGLDVATGRPAGKLAGYVEGAITHHFLRCAGTNATARYLLTGNTMDFMDVASGSHLRSGAARSSCLFGLRVANGMVYTFPVDCGCFKSLRGVLGLAPAEAIEPAPPDTSPRLVKGPAFGQAVEAGAVNPKVEWPCYRHDAARSGRVASPVAERPELLWRRRVGGSLTAPTVAGGLVFVASKDTHRLRALDAATGRAVWSFTPGGPLDTPPTIHGGRCLFGCRNGWVYALRADDGRLIWRRRLAPVERRIIARGRIESPVPAFGSVLAVGDSLYASAGLTSELDGGVRVAALDPATGEVKWRHTLDQPALVPGRTLDQRTLREQGALGGLLVSDGKYVYMRGWRFDLADGKHRYYYRWRGVLQGGGKAGLLDATLKNLWIRWINGQMLVFNDKTTAGFTALKKISWQHAYFTNPGQGEYTLFARNLSADGKPVEADPGWAIKAFPIAVEAMLIAGDRLCVAGPPDALDPKGGKLRVLDLADGKTLSELDLPAPPVFDSLAAANDRLYVSATDGHVLCFGKP